VHARHICAQSASPLQQERKILLARVPPAEAHSPGLVLIHGLVSAKGRVCLANS
jgi:hypothetical protein